MKSRQVVGRARDVQKDTCAARLPIARYSNPLDEARLHQYERSGNRWQ